MVDGFCPFNHIWQLRKPESRPDALPFSFCCRTLAFAEVSGSAFASLPQPPDCGSKRGAGSIRERPQLVKLPYVDEWTKPTGQHPQTPRNRREKAFQAEPEMPPPKRFSLPPGATHSLFQEKREWGAQSRRASPAPPPRPGTGRISAPAGDSDRTIQTEG